MRRKSNLIRVGDAITQLLKSEKLDVRLSQFSVKSSWKEIVGDVVAKNTGEIFFKDKTIFVTLTSAALRHELAMRKSQIVDNINSFCGYRLVEEIVLR